MIFNPDYPDIILIENKWHIIKRKNNIQMKKTAERNTGIKAVRQHNRRLKDR